MCCLGVLCELAIRDGLNVATEKDVDGMTLYDGNSMYPPDKVRLWAGLPLKGDAGSPAPDGFDVVVELDRELILDGVTYMKGAKIGLGELNDGGIPFETIADIIEATM